MTRGLIASESITGLATNSYASQWYPLGASYQSLDIEVSNAAERCNFGFTFSEDKITLIKYEPPAGIVFKKQSIDLQQFSSAKYFRVSASNIGVNVSSINASPYSFDYKIFYNTEKSNSPVYISALSGISNFTDGTTWSSPWVNTVSVNNAKIQFFNNTETVDLIVLHSESADAAEIIKTETFTIPIATSLIKTINPAATFIQLSVISTIPAEAQLNTFFYPSVSASSIEVSNFPDKTAISNISDSLFNDLKVTQAMAVNSHKFDYTTIVGNIIQGPDRNIFQLNSVLVGDTGPYMDEKVLLLSNIRNSVANSYIAVLGSPVIYRGGNPLYASFSAAFDVTGYTNGDVEGFNQMMIGMGNMNILTGDVIDGCFIGFPGGTSINELSLIYYKNGVENYSPQTSWIYDKLDGRGTSKVALDYSKLNTWRLRTAYHGSSSIFLEMHNPETNAWIPVTRIVLQNAIIHQNFENPSFSFLMYTKRTNSAIVGDVNPNNEGPRSCAGVIGIENGFSGLGKSQTYAIGTPVVTLVAGVYTAVFDMNIGHQINGIVSRGLVRLIEISIASDGTKPVNVELRRNGTYTAPVWTYDDAVYSSVQTLTGGSFVPASGYLLDGFFLSKIDAHKSDLTKLDVVLQDSETLNVSLKSAGASDVQIYLIYQMII